MEEKGAIRGPGIALGPRDSELVRRGIPELPVEGLPGAARLPSGAAVPLVDARKRPIGAAVVDPDRGVLRVWSRRPAAAFDAAFFRSKVDAALARRKGLAGSPDTDVFRLLHGDGEGLAGIAVDAWGPFLTVEASGKGPAAWAGAIVDALDERLRPRGIVVKHAFGGEDRGLGRGKVEERVAAGEAPPEDLVVKEAGVPFLVRLRGARHEGLFTDMREERRRLAGLARGRRVLNLFAYTGSFSAVAARAGAAEVVTVDIVAKVLDWAKENLRLSGIDPGLHRFARMDALEYLALARRRGWAFDAIVLDPPTFATSGGRRWSLRRDYPALVEKAVRVLAPRGLLWAAANAAVVPEEEFDRWISTGAAAAGRKLRQVARGGQPIDHPAPPGFPRWSYLKVRVLEG
jgi:23S rRNA (cytosine1962-C5)-methyltransferase